MGRNLIPRLHRIAPVQAQTEPGAGAARVAGISSHFVSFLYNGSESVCVCEGQTWCDWDRL